MWSIREILQTWEYPLRRLGASFRKLDALAKKHQRKRPDVPHSLRSLSFLGVKPGGFVWKVSEKPTRFSCSSSFSVLKSQKLGAILHFWTLRQANAGFRIHRFWMAAHLTNHCVLRKKCEAAWKIALAPWMQSNNLLGLFSTLKPAQRGLKWLEDGYRWLDSWWQRIPPSSLNLGLGPKFVNNNRELCQSFFIIRSEPLTPFCSFKRSSRNISVS